MKILGFDVSSTVTAYCCIDIQDKNIVSIEHGYFKPSKKGSIFNRLSLFEKEIEKIVNKFNPDQIVIEDIIKFMKSNSQANTIITLALFNRQVGLTCFNLNKEPTLYTVLQIRHCIKLGKDLPKKEDVPQVIEKRLNIKFPFIYSKTNKIKQESYDVSDAFAVTLAYAIKNKLM